jgi:hypothetical protein
MLLRAPGRGSNKANSSRPEERLRRASRGTDYVGGYMKSLQLLAGMIVVAVLVSACSSTNTMPVLSGQENPNTGKYTPPASPMPPPKM